MKRLYSTARWQRLRERILSETPLCVLCTESGKTKAATVVDHIKAHKGDADLFWNPVNLRSLCKSCHDSKTARQDNDQAFGRWSRIPEWINAPVIPVILVCGPPGSGKTTYTELHATDDSLIIDPEYIAADLSGELNPNMDKWLAPTMRRRNEMLADLSKPQARNYTDCWFVVSAPRLSDRRKWRDILNPVETYVLETDKETCLQRTANRSKEVKLAVSQWWKQYTQDIFTEKQVVTG